MQPQSIVIRTCHHIVRMVVPGTLALFTIGLAAPEAIGQAVLPLHSFVEATNGFYSHAALIQGKDGALYGTTIEGGAHDDGTVFRVNTDGTGFQTLYAFGTTAGDGAYPAAALIQAKDGALYGTTEYDGANGSGTVFRVNTDGAGFQTLYSFTHGSDGAYPFAGLLQGSDGSLYGTTVNGGAYDFGTVFRVNTDGTGFQTLYAFDTTAGDGSYPNAVIQGKDGALYGTTEYSANGYGSGTVFRVNTDGTGFQTLYAFGTTAGDGSYPNAVIQGQDGTLYGTTESDGANGDGTVFRVNTDGTGFQTLYAFGTTAGDGAGPTAAVIQGKDGALYGTTEDSANGSGTVFRVNTDGTGFQTLYSFTGGSDGANPAAGVIQGQDGALYGTTEEDGASGDGTLFRVNIDGADFQTLYSFSYGSDGFFSHAALIQGQDGALYGTCYEGGANNSGTLFKLNTDGAGYRTLYTFSALDSNGSNTDGADPYSALMQCQDGALYGTTTGGGANGYGTVFKLNTDGTGFQTLYSFTGGSPGTAVIQGKDGALYGTTGYGGAAVTLFKLNTDGTGFQTLYSFTGGSPGTAVIQGQDGALYGTCYEGGANNSGTLFKLNTDGTGYQTLYSFTGGSDGGGPGTAVIQGKDGALYGTTGYGGANGAGTLFKLNTDGAGFQTLYAFGTSTGTNGANAVIQGKDGALYGTTNGGGADFEGTVFRVNTDGTGFQTLYSFTRGSDGAYPLAGLFQGSDGSLYGTTLNGGAYDSGTVFKLVRRAHGFDANGDGASDFLFRNTDTGDVVLWEMNGLNLLNQGFVAQGVPSQWQVAGTGDFNGDGRDDVLWRNTSTGDVYLWEMNGFRIANQGYIFQALPLVWQVAGVGYFSGGVLEDVLWRNTDTGDVILWEMNGVNIVSHALVAPGVPPVWQVAGIGDFNGDGMDDVLWRNTQTGDVYLWEMNGPLILNQGYIFQGLPLVWQVAGVGYFSGRGEIADILWRNTQTGDVYLWEMNGFSLLNGGYVAQGVPSQWQVAGIGDFNGDGRDDVLWRNTQTGDVYVWEMNGLNISGQGYLYQALPLVWQITAP